MAAMNGYAVVAEVRFLLVDFHDINFSMIVLLGNITRNVNFPSID